MSIFQSFQQPGVQFNQEYSQFEAFRQRIEFIQDNNKNDIGKIIESIESKMRSEAATYNTDEYLKDINCHVNMHFRDIRINYLRYKPCKEMDIQKTIKERQSKYSDFLNKIRDVHSPEQQKIFEGLSKKHSQFINLNIKFKYFKQQIKICVDEDEILDRIDEIQDKNIKQIKETEALYKSNQEFLDSCIPYQRYLTMTQILEPHFNRFNEQIKCLGKESNLKGQRFELKDITEFIPLILHRFNLNIDPSLVQVHSNIFFKDQPGEIDKLLIQEDRIFCILEQKNNIFDIAEGWRQMNRNRIDNNRRYVMLNRAVYEIPDDVIVMVVTNCSQNNDYFMGVESGVGAFIAKMQNTVTYEERDWNLIYNFLLERYGQELSPMDWLVYYGRKYLICFG